MWFVILSLHFILAFVPKVILSFFVKSYINSPMKTRPQPLFAVQTALLISPSKMRRKRFWPTWNTTFTMFSEVKRRYVWDYERWDGMVKICISSVLILLKIFVCHYFLCLHSCWTNWKTSLIPGTILCHFQSQESENNMDDNQKFF